MSEHNGYLFEVSWEVCNKVGGIYTVITSKIREAVRAYGDRYILLGPDFKTNPEFEETDEDFWVKIREGTAIKDIPCRFGRWKVPGEPRVILVSFAKKYNKDQLLFRIWEDYGVDSIAGGWDYIEPVMFSYACGEVIETIHNLLLRTDETPIMAQFHEWMCGAGLLGLKKSVPEAGTVFTTHATILGRALAGSGVDIYSTMDHISPQREAVAHNITAKYSMEVAAAREADCFTTVSEITALEAKNFLGRYPDVITPNGLDIERIADLAEDRAPAVRSREKLIGAAAKLLHQDLPAQTKIIAISGRYEFRNKGIDILLDVLGRLDKALPENQTILTYLFVLAGHTDLISALQDDVSKIDTANPPLATHRLSNEASDPILVTCSRLGLRNTPQNRVKVVFFPAYMNGHDGLIDMPYYEALSGCDLGVFPSYYEPWGYTPLESAAYAVPTVTTDQAGFGLWVRQTIGEAKGVTVLATRGRERTTVEEQLYAFISAFLGETEEELQKRRKSARNVACKANWKDFFAYYLQAYAKAADVAQERSARLATEEYGVEAKQVFAGVGSTQPHFRTFTAIANLPQNLIRLRELAYNLWWTWNPKALDLFAGLDVKLWQEMNNNPVRMLETVSPETLRIAARSSSYLSLYAQVIRQFDDYMNSREHVGLQRSDEIKGSAPIAYFCTEYGLHECMPIYSGGLGTLAGDYLKTASDMNVPLVAVGLLYKSGYFRQVIDSNGMQIAEYPESDFSFLPTQIVRDERGNEVQVTVELPGRLLYANIWEIKVGRVSLYLLDTDVQRNTPQDKKVTDRLYFADQRTRIEQEILLGSGGIRLLRKLGIRPSVFHINEGHSAFLLFERIGDLMAEEGLTFEEASEVVRGSTVFTTHTPVEAGNERFSKDLMEYYFANYVKRVGISWSQFWELGRKEAGDDKPFFMTILALKLANASNAVSRMHCQVARRMWCDVWKGFNDSDVPIRHVTNGTHLLSYLAPRMRDLLDVYLGAGWVKHLSDTEMWRRVESIPNTMLWHTRYDLKEKTIDFLQEYVSQNWMKFGYAKTWREALFARINPAALVIGFSRRFAPYKRADLILRDLDRLDRILNNSARPVYLVFAGKAHPNDDMGRNLIKKVVEICREEQFRGKIFFVEDYDIYIARRLLQGVDVWLNTPRRPYEASGTSGQKAVINGVLNLSISDGWWCEGYDGSNGWVIGPVVKDYYEEAFLDANTDEQDSDALYAILENTVIPAYYDRELSGLPERWLGMIKKSMQTLAVAFNSERMLREYYQDMYVPAAKRADQLEANRYRLARTIADWKNKLPMRFSSLRLLDVTVEGIHGDSILVNEPLSVSARVDPGKLDPHEVLVELLIAERIRPNYLKNQECIPLQLAGRETDGTLVFTVEYVVRENGPHSYGIRVLPYNEKVASKVETGLILWG